MLAVAIYIQDTYTSEYNRVDLFDDEKISVTSSIQNINDISKTFTDFSQTFTVPASKQNNKIFRHWYDNSNNSPFSTLEKSNAYIEIDTITFRKGKIQLESANVVDGKPQDYSITFIGLLGNLKDTFAGLYLKDLTDTTYDFVYTTALVKSKVTLQTTSPSYTDIKFPLISSARYWNYNSAVDPTNNINSSTYPIRSFELFPALRLRAVLNMIENKFGINFDGTTLEPSTFLISDSRFTNAFLWLKNADLFVPYFNYQLFPFATTTGFPPTTTSIPAIYKFQSFDTTLMRFTAPSQNTTAYYNQIIFEYGGVASGAFRLELWNISLNKSIYTSAELQPQASTTNSETLLDANLADYQGTVFEVRITAYGLPVTFDSTYTKIKLITVTSTMVSSFTQTLAPTSNFTVAVSTIPVKKYMPEIKIEDFFSGLLKMFNLTCYSNDGINYTVEQLESYYNNGNDVDLTKYIIQDKKALNRVKTYKKINFEYEKSESFVNVAFNSANGVEYGSLLYNTNNDGEEYSIKLPFEDLNFQNLKDNLQVGYVLKTDYQKYIPKPVILYDYNPSALTALTGTTFYFNEQPSGGTTTAYTSYKAFGQETLISGVTYGLNFNQQQSTLTNLEVENGLYDEYYSAYFANIFDLKARLIKVSAILPTSILTSLKLNDNVLIRDAKYLINTMTTDLTTGEVQFELLTDQRQ